MKWYIVDKNYVNYLKSYDNKVHNINYNNAFKPYIGILLNINKFNYFVPVSSAKEKHYTMKNTIDFVKIKDNKKIICVLNINNMIPIPTKCVNELNYKDINKYKTFKNELEKNKFIKLLQKELVIIKREKIKIMNNASKLYDVTVNRKNLKFMNRCCDFKLLEQKCREYN